MANAEPLDASIAKPKPVPAKPMEPGRPKQHEKLKGNTTKRGYGKKNKRRNLVDKINLSLIGTNAAGLTSTKKELFQYCKQIPAKHRHDSRKQT